MCILVLGNISTFTSLDIADSGFVYMCMFNKYITLTKYKLIMVQCVQGADKGIFIPKKTRYISHCYKLTNA